VTTARTSHSAINQEQPISLILNDRSRVITPYKFLYRLDPIVTGVEPKNHLIVYVCVQYRFTSFKNLPGIPNSKKKIALQYVNIVGLHCSIIMQHNSTRRTQFSSKVYPLRIWMTPDIFFGLFCPNLHPGKRMLWRSAQFYRRGVTITLQKKAIFCNDKNSSVFSRPYVNDFQNLISSSLSKYTSLWNFSAQCSFHVKLLTDSQREGKNRITKRQLLLNKTRLQHLHLPSLELRRLHQGGYGLHADLVWCYKILAGIAETPTENFFSCAVRMLQLEITNTNYSRSPLFHAHRQTI